MKEVVVGSLISLLIIYIQRGWQFDRDKKAGRTSLAIDKKPKRVIFHPGGIQYIAWRIIVKNTDKNPAKDCKCSIVSIKTRDKTKQGDSITTEDSRERLCWITPTDNHTVTINPGDSEELDFCAFLNQEIPAFSPFPEYMGEEPPEDLSGLPEVICPKEHGYPKDLDELLGWSAQLKAVFLPPRLNAKGEQVFARFTECVVRITASNADQVNETVKINYDEKTIEII